MKLSLISAAALAALALGGAAQAQAQTIDPQWYVRGEAGATFQDELNATPKVKGDTGWTASVAVGRRIAPHFRAEGELIYSDANQKHADGRMKVTTGLVNGYYDFDTGTKFTPFVGAGVGIGQVKLDGGVNDGDDTGFAYKLQAGVAYPVSDRLSAQVAYRYLGISDVEISSRAGPVHGDYHDQALTAGLTYAFGS